MRYSPFVLPVVLSVLAGMFLAFLAAPPGAAADDDELPPPPAKSALTYPKPGFPPQRPGRRL